jgi:hypothetical protein
MKCQSFVTIFVRGRAAVARRWDGGYRRFESSPVLANIEVQHKLR